jgi:nucleoside diphosphate kinase
MANARETSLILVKHDGLQRGLVGEVIKRFENRGFKLIGIKFVQVTFSEYCNKLQRIIFTLAYSCLT